MADPSPPFPPLTRETTIRRDRAGVWYQDGVALEHTNLVRAFDAWVDRADDGRYCLRNDINWAYVEIEGAPIFVRAVRIDGDRVMLSLSDGREEPLSPATLRLDREGRLHCDVRGGKLAAAFDAHAMVGLGPVLEDVDGEIVLRVGGAIVRAPEVEDPLLSRSVS